MGAQPNDISTLKEEFELASFLESENFENWSDVSTDQYEKALKLYEHIVSYYPENEYKVIQAKAAIGGLKLRLHGDVKACVYGYIDIFSIPAERVSDSTDTEDDPTQAVPDFEAIKDSLREKLIQLCSDEANPELHSLLNYIIEVCETTDPEIAELAETAKAGLRQSETEK